MKRKKVIEMFEDLETIAFCGGDFIDNEDIYKERFQLIMTAIGIWKKELENSKKPERLSHSQVKKVFRKFRIENQSYRQHLDASGEIQELLEKKMGVK